MGSVQFSDGECLGGNAFTIHSKFSAVSHSPETIATISNRETLEMNGHAGSINQTKAKRRVLFFDQIKALMIALVITVNVPLAFYGNWMGVRIPMEGISDPVFGTAYRFFSYSCQTFFMYMLFLI